MDPLVKIPEELGDLVFQHLSADEILEASFVSTSWYEAIGKSGNAMSKIWLNAGDRYFNPPKEDFKLFINSPRNYENFRISEMENGLLFVVFPRRRWKRAQLDIQSFITYKEYVKLLEIIEPSISELQIFDMNIEDVKCNENLEFKSLTKLRLSSLTLIGLKPFLKRFSKLTHLVIEDIFDLSVAEYGKEFLVEILSLNSQINNLSLNSKILNKILDAEEFSNSLKNVKNLNKFSFEFEEEKNLTKDFYKNFDLFLSIQENLTWIILCDCGENLIFTKILNNIKTLKRLSIDYFDDTSFEINPENLKFNQNSSIKHLDFDLDGLTLDFLKPFLLACKQIEILYVFHLAPDTLAFLTDEINKSLKLVKYCSISKNINQAANSSFKIVEEKFVNLKKIF